MLTRRRMTALSLALLFAAVAAGTARADASARGFVAGIYKFYTGNNAEGLTPDSPLYKPLFTPSLYKLIDADLTQADKRGEPPELNGDPFVDAQEWEITELKIDIAEQAGKASARVSFRNSGEPRTVTLELVRLQGKWRIDDIAGREGSLRKMLSKN